MKQQLVGGFILLSSCVSALLFAGALLPVALTSAQGPAAASNRSASDDYLEQFLPTGKCREISSCKLRGRRRDLDVGPNKYHCYCDKKCEQHDDCCLDSPWTESIKERAKLGPGRLEERRAQWHCRRINNIFGDIVLRAGCSAEWMQQQSDPKLAALIRRRCEYVKDRGKQQPAAAAAAANDELPPPQLDPIGMMMPITDLASGTTYANSYCLRCNTLKPSVHKVELNRRKLIYWSPLLECNYNMDSDERNTLYDLISTKKGQALEYSSKRNKWVIVTSAAAGNRTGIDDSERVCSIMPTIPDSVEHMIRFCKANLVHSCPSTNNSTSSDERMRRARFECEFGHQSITYSLTSKAVYYNLACALCNGETRAFCEPKSSRRLPGGKPQISIMGGGGDGDSGAAVGPANDRHVFAPPSEAEMLETTTTTGADLISSGARANSHEASSSGSFSVLMDLYGSSHDADLAAAAAGLAAPGTASALGSKEQCTEQQVFDPFYLTCRCMVCGLNHKFVDGKCVDKFKPAMVYITDVCLVVSITSLALYLLMYALSTFDLRPLAVQLAQWQQQLEADEREQRRQQQQQQQQNSKESCHNQSSESNSGGGGGGGLDKGKLFKRHSQASSEGGRGSQSLSTRGVASLAGSLLAAYSLFMLGHQTETAISSRRQPICAGLAVATYYCFLVSFCWMFLLSYDIWRTLRLATCQFRGPAMHSQSARFLSYTLCALLLSAALVGFALLIDQWPSTSCQAGEQPAAPAAAPATQATCPAATSWGLFVQVYRPNFGHQPGSCWFSNRRALTLFFGLPVTLIMVSNLLFFLHSSYMVIRTSSRSSRHLSKSSSTYNHTHHHHQHHPQSKFVSLERGLASGGADFTHENSLTTSSMISVQTLQSHLSAASSVSSSSSSSTSSSSSSSSSGSEECLNNPPPPPPDGAINREAPASQPSSSLPLPPPPPPPPPPVVPSVASLKQQQQPAAAAAAAQLLKKQPPPHLAHHHSKLESSQSSNSLATNHSGCSSSHSIASSLAMKYDSHLASIQSMMGSIVKDYRLYCRLSTIMGLTWLTGLLASLVDQSETLWYLFVVLNTLQGLFIFIAFGCKRSKLSNLELLFNYLRFRLLLARRATRSSSPAAAAAAAAKELAPPPPLAKSVSRKDGFIIATATAAAATN